MSRTAYIPGSIDLTDTIGATYIGVVLSTFIGGIAFQQALVYHRNFPKDLLFFKLAVLSTFILSLLHTAFIVYAQYFWTVTSWGDPIGLNKATIPYPTTFCLTGLTALIVQSAYAYRIYVMNGRSFIIPIVVLILSLMQFAASIYATHGALSVKLQSLFLPYFDSAYVWLYGEFAADVVITTSLVWFLQTAKSQTQFERTKSLVNRISLMTMETNGLSAVSCVLSAVLLQVRKDGWGPAVNFLTVKLYVLSLLITLNARRMNIAPGIGSSTRQPSTDHELARVKQSSYFNRTPASIQVQKSVEVNFDSQLSFSEKDNIHPTFSAA